MTSDFLGKKCFTNILSPFPLILSVNANLFLELEEYRSVEPL